MTDQRNWREAKMPQWVKDSIAEELKAVQLTSALSWPTEAKPAPMPFQWGDYDRLYGVTPVPGRYWAVSGNRPEQFDLQMVENLPEKDQVGLTKWKNWAFKYEGRTTWSTTIIRGPLFDNERNAYLYVLWDTCEDFAKKLMKLKDML